MNLLKKLRLFPLLVFVFSILFSVSVTSCGKVGQGDDKESTEHPAAEEGEKSEHPEKADEHPTEKADTTKTEQQ